MSRVLLANGGQVEPGAPAVPADDPGLYGHGVYESLRTYDGEPFAVARHLRRLAAGLARLGLEADLGVVEQELRRAAALAREQVGGELTLRLLVTAGGTRIVEALPLLVRSPTARAVTLPWSRPADGPLAGVKVASTAAVLVARRFAAEHGADEAIWLTPQGHVSEAIAANVFCVLGGRLVTPPLADGALPGVTRALHLDLGAVEQPITLPELAAADEAFLSATSLPARALVAIDGQAIAGGEPGPVTRDLAATFVERAEELSWGAR